ncbi:hypothetical protein EC18_14010 [Salmonella enterica subsp. enterica serovar Bareilly str. CFSAN000215]|nr:DNA methylase N-4/N-6 domain-containing protein [Salmonella enterica subsp. enterica serovar Paratyphi B str. ATCC 51962]KFT46281.1 hypothetical protein EC18_14010 [Salmonella enterica subsp. enterica serovar Bareilly str. CFSAN000215]KFT62390.1 hypothetical protein SEEB0213_00800 [Salmonella enterica subsp. enterica serovar Bareilly str. CFSAN000213]KFU38360.1 hypothetical protein SEEB0188_08080 [Salmonella enterica subsp. enterica serovar Bareilly str. CFSAN000188]KFU42614.1 hypothetical p
MSRLTDLIAKAKAKDPQLGADLDREIKILSSRLPFVVIHNTQGSRHWESLMLKLNSTRLFVPISCSLPNRMAK